MFSEEVAPLLLRDVSCTGTESTLLNCTYNTRPQYLCGRFEDAGVVCQGVCMCVGVHVCMHLWVHACMHAFVGACMYACACICGCMHVCMHVYVCNITCTVLLYSKLLIIVQMHV